VGGVNFSCCLIATSCFRINALKDPEELLKEKADPFPLEANQDIPTKSPSDFQTPPETAAQPS